MDRFEIGVDGAGVVCVLQHAEEIDPLLGGRRSESRGRSQARPAQAAGRSRTIEYPKARPRLRGQRRSTLAEDFELLGERDAKNEYVLELGETCRTRLSCSRR